jgi:hypothetical protein
MTRSWIVDKEGQGVYIKYVIPGGGEGGTRGVVHKGVCYELRPRLFGINVELGLTQIDEARVRDLRVLDDAALGDLERATIEGLRTGDEMVTIHTTAPLRFYSGTEPDKFIERPA